MIIKSNLLVPKGFDAITIGFLIFIRPEAINNQVLIEHENIHVKQFKRNPLMPILYLLSCKYRLRYEVEAYKNNIALGRDVFSCAKALTMYKCNLTLEEAVELLTK